MDEYVKSGWSIQTILLLAGACAGIGGALLTGGYTLSQIQNDTNRNSIAVGELSTRMERNDSKTDLNEVRIASLEKIASDALTLRRELEKTVTEFNSDIAVIKEILQRMDSEVGEKE